MTMQKVIAINLNGNAYHVEESGYDALIAYLDAAQRTLRDNPDRDEILADLEQAIAEKCQRFLGAHKTVVSAAEVDQIVKEMGPVGGAAEPAGGAGAGAAAGQPHTSAGLPPRRRLYRTPDEAMLAGICGGIGAFFGIDPTIVRVVFVVLLFATGGGFAILYLVLAFVLPSARTPEERAAAYGEPFNAQEVIDRAKKQYGDFADSGDWGRRWRSQQRRWRRQWRMRRRDWRSYGWTAAPYAPVPPTAAGYPARVLAGFTVPIVTLFSVALFWLWLFALFSLVTRQEVFGQPLPDEVPLWLGIVILVFIYQAFAWPLHMARRSAYYAIGGANHGAVAAFDGLLSLGFAVLGVWLAFHYMPEVRDFLRQLPDVFRSLAESLRG
jgi:phage shock protein PspC (stress-responsive transcriptional regulator)